MVADRILFIGTERMGSAMKKPIFNGCATALATPYTSSGIDYDSLCALIQRQIEAGVSAILACATTGEAATLTREERREIISFTVREASGRVKVLAGIGSNNTQAALEAAREAESSGADAVLLTAPYYNKTSRDGLLRHFTTVADGCGLPLIVYNVPSRTAIGCTPEIYEALAEHPRINGVKEASGDFTLISRAMRRCGDELAFWSGNDDQTLAMMAMGARGVISVASNLIPREMSLLCESALSGDFSRARAIHRAYADLFEALFSEVNPIPVKTALHAMGFFPGDLRLPLCPMTPGKETALLQTLRRHMLI